MVSKTNCKSNNNRNRNKMINMNYMLATTSITTPEYDIPPRVYSFSDYEYIVYENNIHGSSGSSYCGNSIRRLSKVRKRFGCFIPC